MPGADVSLWLAAFYPARGVLGRPFHLPGRSLALSALHAPYALPRAHISRFSRRRCSIWHIASQIASGPSKPCATASRS